MAQFDIGDAVTVKDHGKGTVVEVAMHDDHHFVAGHEQMYGVRLTPWVKEGNRFKNPATGELRDHEADTLGCVPESQIKFV